MERERANRVEVPSIDSVTETSKSFFVRRAFWKTAEVTHDSIRYATLPLCLIGNIVKNTFKTVEETLNAGPNATSAAAGAGCLLFYEMLLTPPSIYLLSDGIRRLGEGDYVAGIGFTAVGGIIQAPNALILASGIWQGTIDTYQHTKAKNQVLQEKKAARRASWK